MTGEVRRVSFHMIRVRITLTTLSLAFLALSFRVSTDPTTLEYVEFSGPKMLPPQWARDATVGAGLRVRSCPGLGATEKELTSAEPRFDGTDF